MSAFTRPALLLASAIGFYPIATAAPILPDNPPAVSVGQVVSMQALAGHTVVVSGHCLDRHAPALANGSRPYSSAWQLEDNGVATWVLGPMPASCAEGSAVVTGQVVQETLPRMSIARTLQQYLVVR